MKFVFAVCLFLSATQTIAQTEQETHNIATFCKVWGFLKYFHPEVSNGKLDWDKEFMIRVKTASALKSKEETSKFYLEWIESLGKVKKCRKCKDSDNMNEKWDLPSDHLIRNEMFSDDLKQKILFIESNRYLKLNRYNNIYEGVKHYIFDKENAYADSVRPSESLRLLALARYWNIFQYFFPYKYANSTPWENVLPEMIPKFVNADLDLEYEFALLELSGKVDDSHSRFGYNMMRKCFGSFYAPFEFRIIDQKAIVTKFYDDSLANLNDIKIGDAITHVNGISIKDFMHENDKYLAASNEPTRIRKYWNVLFHGFSDSIEITYERDLMKESKIIKRYLYSDFNKGKTVMASSDTCRILPNNIGYIPIGDFTNEKLDSIIARIKLTDGLIIDLRGYPRSTPFPLNEYLNDDKKVFAKLTYPNFKFPGQFEFSDNIFCGKKNDEYYKGKVVILFNEHTQSSAEFYAMTLQTLPNVTCVGSQTAGADGNATEFMVPGGYNTVITCLGVYYPDGRETQRIGIVPDIEVKPTIQGIREGRDEVLEKAIEVINKQ